MKLKTVFTLVCILLINVTLSAQEVFSGDFESDSYFTSFEGHWQIIKTDSGFKVKFKDDFEAKKAPDLKIFLSKLNFKDIKGKNAADSNTSVLIAKLSKYKGEMEFDFPAGIDPNDYKSIIVHCEEYTKLWGGSSLK